MDRSSSHGIEDCERYQTLEPMYDRNPHVYKIIAWLSPRTPSQRTTELYDRLPGGGDANKAKIALCYPK